MATLCAVEPSSLAARQFTLNNGLRVVLGQDRRLPLAACSLLLPAGSRHDPVGGSGLAHLCEHVAMAAAPTREIEGASGLSNASTSYDHTCFSTLVASNRLAVCLRAEARRLFQERPPVDEADIRRHVNILRQELRQLAANPVRQHIQTMQHRLYQGHAYAHLPSGDAAGLGTLSPELVASFFERRYGPSGAVLAITGTYDRDEVMDVIEGDLDALPANQPGADSGELPPIEPCHVALRDEAGGAHLYLGFRAPGRAHPEWPTAALALRALAIGPRAPVRQALSRHTGFRAVDASLISMRDSSTALIHAAVADRSTLPEQASILTEALDQVMRNGVDDRACARAKAKALTDYYSSMERLVPRCEHLAVLAAVGRSEVPDDEQWRGQTPETLNRFIRERFRPADRVLLSVS